MVDLNRDGAEAVAAEIEDAGGSAMATETDVSDEAAVVAAIDATVQRFGRLDVLHNNAALLAPEVFGLDADVAELAVDVWDLTMAVNLRSVMLGCKHAIPAMLATGGGSIINTSSSSALAGDTVRAAYAASKAAIIAFTRSTATMYGKRGIRCNSVVPGVVISPQNRTRLSTRQLRIWEENCLVPYLGEPEDIAAAVAFLASDDARYITGQALSVDGGSLAHQPTFAQAVWNEDGP